MPLEVENIGVIPYTYDNFVNGLQTDLEVELYYIFNQSDESVLYKNLYTVLDQDETSYIYKIMLGVHNNEYLGTDKHCDTLKINYIKNVVDYILIYAIEVVDINNSILSSANKKLLITNATSKYEFKCIEETIRCKYGLELLNLYFKLIKTAKNYLSSEYLLFGDLQEVLFGNNKEINTI